MDLIEISKIVIGLFVLLFILQNYYRFRERKNFKIIFGAFFLLFLGWIFDYLDYLYYSVLNIIQHTLLAIGFIIMAIWFWKEFHQGGKNEHNRND
ncbi:MAG: membrane protein of unknown function [Promethearchaeota archaeon]|nr:MAG: membrane protein of unknown function [Candidatus Lokiarchaeota archaeon]